MSALLYEKIHSLFRGLEKKSLPALCLELLSEQKKQWEGLRDGYESLKAIRERDIACNGFSVRLQHNPRRLRNSLAGTGEKGVSGQQCFLCLDHLPEGQKGILYRDEYLILPNPMPVFPSHFTVSHLDHRPQDITEPIDTFLHLMADFGPDWAVLYNGPKCGASAPDHLHFQAVPSGQMPIEAEIREEKRLALVTRIDEVVLYRLRNLGREVIVLEGYESTAMKGMFIRFLKALRNVLALDEEPMMNVAGFHNPKKWRLVIFPRRKHRPDAFFREGANRVVVSPGVIDMGGVIITPVTKDFDRLDATAVEGVYREVSLERKIVKRATEMMVSAPS